MKQIVGEQRLGSRRRGIEQMRAASHTRYWWDYMRLRSCLYSWLVEQRADPAVTVLTGGGMTVHIRRSPT